MVSKLIALNSPLPGSGKSTLARHLVEEHGFQRIPFAQVLKDMTVVLLKALGYGEERAQELVSTDKAYPLPELDGVTPRHIMQTLGTNWGRKLVHPDVWVRAWMGRARTALHLGGSVVVDDMRFPNELGAVVELGGTPLRVVRPGLIRGPEADHESEGRLDGEDMEELVVPELLVDALQQVMGSFAQALVRKIENTPEEPPVVVMEEGEEKTVDEAVVEEFYRGWMKEEYGLATKPNRVTTKLLLAAVSHFTGREAA